ncbi:MAG TPA: MBL fold metallo-hydrolase [Syntrophomonas sp.]|nr:MBL fold metallo-hydrolase [Syntrophomonas sp.]
MIREVVHNIFQIMIPLPGNPLKAINTYLIKGPDRSLLIDTGFNWPECRQAQLDAMNSLRTKWGDIDFFITHAHGDHCGLVFDLATRDAAVYGSRTDADLLKKFTTTSYWEKNNAYYIDNGYPEQDIQKPGDNPLEWVSGVDMNYVYVKDGDVINIGDYALTCIATPGHTPGHMCLYEPHHKFLLAGDHILDTITSNITSWGGTADYLGLYLQSLDKINALDIEIAFPGHRTSIIDVRDRIAGLKRHHQVRLAEVMSIMQQDPMTAYEIAGRMHWDVKCNGWEEFPVYQKWFAVGEALAHLEHLAASQKVHTEKAGDKIVYIKS